MRNFIQFKGGVCKHESADPRRDPPKEGGSTLCARVHVIVRAQNDGVCVKMTH